MEQVVCRARERNPLLHETAAPARTFSLKVMQKPVAGERLAPFQAFFPFLPADPSQLRSTQPSDLSRVFQSLQVDQTDHIDTGGKDVFSADF